MSQEPKSALTLSLSKGQGVERALTLSLSKGASTRRQSRSRFDRLSVSAAVLTLLLPTPALAQGEPPPVEVEIVGGSVKAGTVVAVPAMPSPISAATPMAKCLTIFCTALFPFASR